MDKKVIDNIVWYIPFRKLRDAVREYLKALVTPIIPRIPSNSSPSSISQAYQRSILDLMWQEAAKESVKYICENGSNARMFT